MKINIKTFAGLEQVLAKEVEELGGKDIEILNRMVSCEGDKRFLYSANFQLRTALKILVPIKEFHFENMDEYYQNIFDVNWYDYFDVDKSIFIDSVVNSQMFNNTQFAVLKAKDAVVDKFKEKYLKRPFVKSRNSNIKINIFIKENFCVLSLDSSGEALFKRNYRVQSGDASINEVLAAGMIKISGWNQTNELLDFMCGSGTIPIEGTLIGLNIPPQYKRREFAFCHWHDFEPNLWENVREEALQAQSIEPITVMASDISQKMVDAAAENIANAGLSGYIKLQRANYINVRYNRPKHIIINPPYGKRIGTGKTDINSFYKEIGDTLKHNFTNSEAWIISSNMQAMKHIGLRATKKVILYNGPLESRFQKYELY